MQKDEYLGIDKEYSSLYKQGGSKFFGYLLAVKDLDDAKQQISEFKERFVDATHVCTAYILGSNRDVQYFNDDGEPSNSAGRPILYALLSSNMSFILGVVVRYYGGKKLGVPGLIQSYGGAIQECIDQAQIKTLQLSTEIHCSISPDLSYQVYNFLNSRKDIVYHVNDGEFKIQCAQSMTPELLSELNKIPTLVVREKK